MDLPSLFICVSLKFTAKSLNSHAPSTKKQICTSCAGGPWHCFFYGKSCIRNLERTQRMDSWVIPDSYATEFDFFISSSWYKHISLSLLVKVVKVEVSSLPSLLHISQTLFQKLLVNLEILYCLINQGFQLITHHISYLHASPKQYSQYVQSEIKFLSFCGLGSKSIFSWIRIRKPFTHSSIP